MRSRRRAVRAVVVSTATFVLMATVVMAIKLVSLSAIAGVSIARFEAGAFDRSVESSENLFDYNLFEPWIAYFDRGTATAAQGKYNESISDLQKAFGAAPADRRCDVALNLSLAWELLGDQYVQQGQFAGAKKLYALAKAALDAAGDGCGGTEAAPDPAAPPTGAGSPRQRLGAKSQRAQQLDQAAKEQSVPGAPDPLGALRNQGDAAQQEKSNKAQERSSGPFGSQPGDKPW